MQTIGQYDIFSLEFSSAEPVRAVFSCVGQKRQAEGFRMGDITALRFMPDIVGTWRYEAVCGGERRTGEFVCTPAREGVHGPVRVQDMGFSYADGTRFLPFSTTCYAWAYQGEAVVADTLAALKASPFNKVRMCIFPKFMAFNGEEPPFFPFARGEDGWQTDAPDEVFWTRLEHCICALGEAGIEAELILFHPYDRWGFSEMSVGQCLAYLRYCVRRLGAFRNVWWSLANEYDLMTARSAADWDAFGACIREEDAVCHPVSIHDFCAIYPPRSWMTHLSVQTQYPQRALVWRARYRLPVVVDECGYEGDLPFAWGNLSAKAFVARMWEAVMGGGYCTHGETFYSPDEIIWWAKGGTLRGEAVARVAFLRRLLESLPPLAPAADLGAAQSGTVAGQFTAFGRALHALSEDARDEAIADMVPPVLVGEGCSLWYFRGCPAWADVAAPRAGRYIVEAIDTFAMTRERVMQIEGSGRVPLPAREGMAVLLTKIEEKEYEIGQ